jgi:hypothetical protein
MLEETTGIENQQQVTSTEVIEHQSSLPPSMSVELQQSPQPSTSTRLEQEETLTSSQEQQGPVARVISCSDGKVCQPRKKRHAEMSMQEVEHQSSLPPNAAVVDGTPPQLTTLSTEDKELAVSCDEQSAIDAAGEINF